MPSTRYQISIGGTEAMLLPAAGGRPAGRPAGLTFSMFFLMLVRITLALFFQSLFFFPVFVPLSLSCNNVILS